MNFSYIDGISQNCAYESRKQAKGRLTSLDGVSVLNSVGRGPSTTRAAFYRSPPPSSFSVTSPPFTLILFATACPIDCYQTRRRRERSRTNPSSFSQSQFDNREGPAHARDLLY